MTKEYLKNKTSWDRRSKVSQRVTRWPWHLTHWGRVTHICVSRLTITGSDNGLSPGRRQAIIWTNAEILLIGPLGTNFSENSIEILTFSFKKMRLKVSTAKWRPFCLGLNVLKGRSSVIYWSTRMKHKLKWRACLRICCYGSQDLLSLSVSMITGDCNWQPFWMVAKLEDSLYHRWL